VFLELGRVSQPAVSQAFTDYGKTVDLGSGVHPAHTTGITKYGDLHSGENESSIRPRLQNTDLCHGEILGLPMNSFGKILLDLSKHNASGIRCSDRFYGGNCNTQGINLRVDNKLKDLVAVYFLCHYRAKDA
jgi:hypothetical protein